jgi:shikimate kinase
MKTFSHLQEGVNDPNIFKAFFLAGGPGSGKSYVVRKTTGGLGMRVVNSDDAFEKKLKDAGHSLDTRAMDTQVRDKIRDRAKEITKAKQTNYIEGRLGLIIDGTGKDFEKITRQARNLEAIGYDTHMIFVNTSLDVALQRNADRARKLAEPLVVKSWNDVQKNIGKFNNFFKGNFIIIDNNNATEDILTDVFKRVRSLANKKIQNKRAQQWINNELQMRNITKFKRRVV